YSVLFFNARTHELFPYTTLFRSVRAMLGPGKHQRAIDRFLFQELGEDGRFGREIDLNDALGDAHHSGRFLGQTGHPRPAPETGTDRKSTRLNSSHVAISYAVFCL